MPPRHRFSGGEVDTARTSSMPDRAVSGMHRSGCRQPAGGREEVSAAVRAYVCDTAGRDRQDDGSRE